MKPLMCHRRHLVLIALLLALAPLAPAGAQQEEGQIVEEAVEEPPRRRPSSAPT